MVPAAEFHIPPNALRHHRFGNGTYRVALSLSGPFSSRQAHSSPVALGGWGGRGPQSTSPSTPTRVTSKPSPCLLPPPLETRRTAMRGTNVGAGRLSAERVAHGPFGVKNTRPGGMEVWTYSASIPWITSRAGVHTSVRPHLHAFATRPSPPPRLPLLNAPTHAGDTRARAQSAPVPRPRRSGRGPPRRRSTPPRPRRGDRGIVSAASLPRCLYRS